MFFKDRPQQHQRARGSHFEALAEKFLTDQGLRPVKRNYTCRMGEIDLIMRHQQTLVFVEVRYRKRSDFGHPLETVTIHKQRKLLRTAEHYLQKHFANQPPDCRVDVIAIGGTKHAQETENPIEWIPNAFGVPPF